MPTKNRTTYAVVIFCPNYTVKNSGQNNATTIKNSLAEMSKDNMWAWYDLTYYINPFVSTKLLLMELNYAYKEQDKIGRCDILTGSGFVWTTYILNTS